MIVHDRKTQLHKSACWLTFKAIVWSGTAISFLFVVGRLAARFKQFRRLYIDDAMVVFAWVLLLVIAILWQELAQYVYLFYEVVSGQDHAPPSDFASKVELYFRSSIGLIILFYSGLWSVKLAFLIFFRRLSENVSGQKALWWCVTIFTIASYFVCIGNIEYKCLVESFAWLQEHCSTKYTINFQRDTLKVNCALDVVSDYGSESRLAT